MNTKPDEQLLALWVEDELAGDQADAVEAWAAARPEWLARREQARACRAMLRRALPAAEEPPYAEFFQARIGRAVEAAAAALANVGAPPAARRDWRWWGPSMAAAAAMALCFWAGTRFGPAEPAPATSGQSPGPATPTTNVYTPEQGVQAKVFEGGGSEGIVIVLDGVQAIPDSFEIPAPAEAARGSSPSSSTAATLEPEAAEERTQ